MTDFMATVGEIAEIYDGPHATPKKTIIGPYFLSISSLENGRLDLSKSAHLEETDFNKWTKRVTPQEGDLLFSYETRLGEAALMPAGVKACLGRRMGLLRPNIGKVIPEYLLYAYLSPYFQQTIVSNTIRGATVDRIALSELPEFGIRIPALPEQIKISSLLRAIDSKIELNNHINAELEAMAKTLYDYWFVQFDFPDKNDKPYKTSGGKMVYNKTLKREIPEGWSDINVGDVLDKIPVRKKIPNKEILEEGLIPVVDQSMGYISGFTNDTDACLKVETAHIIFGDHTRILKLITFDYARGADGTQVLVSKIDEIPVYLLYQSLKDIDLSSYGYARHYKFLKESLIIRPNKDLAKKYESIAQKLYKKIREGVLEKQQLTQLRDWLLPMLMNGQVTVS